MALRPIGPVPTASRARLAAVALALVLAGALVACSSDGSDGGDAKATTTTAAGDKATTTTAGGDATTSTAAAPADGDAATTTTAASSGGGSSSSFSGPVDGQDGVVVRFERGAAALTDLTAEGLSLACMPLGDGEESTTATDVVLPEVPVDAQGRVEFTDPEGDFQPTVSGEFNAAGQFVGSLSLNGDKGDSACGGEFSFIATAG